MAPCQIYFWDNLTCMSKHPLNYATKIPSKIYPAMLCTVSYIHNPKSDFDCILVFRIVLPNK